MFLRGICKELVRGVWKLRMGSCNLKVNKYSYSLQSNLIFIGGRKSMRRLTPKSFLSKFNTKNKKFVAAERYSWLKVRVVGVLVFYFQALDISFW